MLASKMSELKAERESIAEELDSLYRDMKKKLGLQEGQEIDVKTGEILDPETLG